MELRSRVRVEMGLLVRPMGLLLLAFFTSILLPSYVTFLGALVNDRQTPVTLSPLQRN